ncbi:Prolipoprotein diacylglyceryl transferase [Elusimicrobium minutum Pei191]|uniref:Phosphatidylglycerol--prolipoprotein diacylglyceryl transferase n=1 Tax=Elusimicrobium minutum (strain Pei191) TaxID=445932 RepID=B2KBA9_ELUMP|nr:prolipoprotein diacylglyceryl transferase [Elusimicrobium minutum]ACC97931.1 Prolipoprotein diacylglyceryl transferase [Elusimicrobium minutum Pei191]
MYPVLFKIGNFSMSTYGLMNMLGYIAGIYYLIYNRKKIGISTDTLWNILFISIICAIVGGKLMYVFLSWDALGYTFADKMSNIFLNFRYGFVFFGGAIAGILGLLVYIKYKKMPLLKTGDFLAVGLPLGHAIGRIGCFLVGCCYGRHFEGPWAVHFTNPDSLVPTHLHGVGLHPTQLYEVFANLLIFGILHFAYRRRHKHGFIMALYMICYSVLRFIMEFFRGDFRGGFLLGMSPSQVISIGMILAAVIFYMIVSRKSEYNVK